MIVSKTNKITDNKIKRKMQAQYKWDKQKTKISALSSGIVNKYEFLTGEDILLEKYLLEKAATIKRSKYSPLDSVLKIQTAIVKNNIKD